MSISEGKLAGFRCIHAQNSHGTWTCMLVFVHLCMHNLQGVNMLTISYTCGEKNCTRPGLMGKMVLLSVRPRGQ